MTDVLVRVVEAVASAAVALSFVVIAAFTGLADTTPELLLVGVLGFIVTLAVTGWFR